MVYYGLTIKATSNENKKKGVKGLDEILNEICRFTGSVLFNTYYELDSKYLVHLHATILSKIMINPFLLKRRGWHIYLKVCQNIDDWQNYCAKDQNKKNCVKYYEKNYGFIGD